MTGSILGLAIGMLLGLTGAGGGILAVPALMFGLRMPLADAAPVALIAVGAAAAVGAAQGLRQGLVRYKAAVLMAVAGGLTAPAGLQLARQLPPAWLSLGFAAIMVIVATRMIRSPGGGPADAAMPAAKPCRLSPETGKFIWTGRAAATLGAIGAVSGLCTGMLGVGGGFIIVPAFSYFTDARMHSIVSTSLMIIALVSAATVASAATHGLALSAPQWAFIGAAVAGMGVSRGFAQRVPQVALRRAFALACLVVAALLAWRAMH